jgi:hypothetical protein
VGRELSTINTTAGLAKARASITIIPVFHASHAMSICNLSIFRQDGIAASTQHPLRNNIETHDPSHFFMRNLAFVPARETWSIFIKNMTFINSFY